MGVKDHLSITVTQEAERAVLMLDGELDMASAPQLQRAVEDPELAGTGLVVLDLHRLEFIDSTGLRIILAARKLCSERDQELAVTQGSQQVERLLSVTGMSEHLRTVSSTD